MIYFNKSFFGKGNMFNELEKFDSIKFNKFVIKLLKDTAVL